MRRFFVKNLLFVIAVNLLVKPVWVLLIDRTVQNRVGHAAYGTYQALLNVGIIFQILLDFGLIYYNTRIIAHDPKKLKEVFPVMFSTRLLFIVAYISIVFLAGWFFGYRGWELSLLSGILLIQALNSMMLFLRSNVSALHKFQADGLLSVTDRLLMILICGSLLMYYRAEGAFKIEWFVWTQVLCYAIAIFVAFLVLRRIAAIRFRFSVDVKEVTRIIKESLPYASLVFLMAIHMRIDTILVERLAGKEQAGIYAAGYRLLDVSNNMFGLMFAGILLPLFGRMLSQREDTTPIIRLSVNMLLPFSFALAILSTLFRTEIMTEMYRNVGTYSGNVFAWLMFAFPAFCMMYIFSTLLTANGNLILLNKIAIAGVLLNITLNVWLINRDQALGAAMATCITQSFLAVCYIFFSARTFSMATDMKWLAAHAGFVLLSFGTTAGIRLLPLHWAIQLSGAGFLCVFYLFVFRFISLAAIKQLLARKSN